jgi:hypothetical protein
MKKTSQLFSKTKEALQKMLFHRLPFQGGFSCIIRAGSKNCFPKNRKLKIKNIKKSYAHHTLKFLL